MTIADILDRMEIFDNELSTGSAEADETRSITAINIVQDWFEALAAGQSEMLQGYSTLTTTANTEVSNWPTGLLRLDSLWYVDTDNTPNLPQWQLEPMYETGGHRPSLSWPETVTLSLTTGKPRRYYATGPHTAGRIFWEPVPDAVHTIRYYGLRAATDYTLRADTFAYPDGVSPFIAQEAAKLLRLGLDETVSDLQRQAAVSLSAALDLCRRWWNDEAGARHYADAHDT